MAETKRTLVISDPVLEPPMPSFSIPSRPLLAPMWLLVGACLAACGPRQIPQTPEAPPSPLVRLATTGVFGTPETLSLASAQLDSLCAAHPYLAPESLAVLDPDTAWERNLRAGEARFGEGPCENCQDGFFAVAAISLSRRHPGLEHRREALQRSLNTANHIFSCLDGGGTHHTHMVSRIPLLTENALAGGIRSGFQTSSGIRKSDLDSLILLERPGRIEDPDEPQSSEVNCLAKFQDRFPDDPWILEQTVKALDRF